MWSLSVDGNRLSQMVCAVWHTLVRGRGEQRRAGWATASWLKLGGKRMVSTFSLRALCRGRGRRCRDLGHVHSLFWKAQRNTKAKTRESTKVQTSGAAPSSCSCSIGWCCSETPAVWMTLSVTVLRMSERYTQPGCKGALLVMVLVISAWEMTEPTEGASGERTNTHLLPSSLFCRLLFIVLSLHSQIYQLTFLCSFPWHNLHKHEPLISCFCR